MNTPVLPEADRQALAAAKAVRFGLAAIVLGLSYPNIRCAWGISRFGLIYQDMLAGRPLPGITTFVLQAQPVLLGLSILIPIVAIAVNFSGRLARSIYVSGALVLAVFFQLFFTWQAVAAPLFEVIRGMQGAAP